MKSKRNLTRFTYETAAFEGWRLCITRAGTTFSKYFSDKQYGSSKKSLAAAEKALAELKPLIDSAKRVKETVEGSKSKDRLAPSTLKKAEKFLSSIKA
jgi:hypothetical protein